MILEPDNNQDTLNSRDVVRRLEELDDLAERHAEEPGEGWYSDGDAEEHQILRKLNAQGEGYSDWRHGTTMVRDSYWVDYVKQYAEDTGDADSKPTGWPYTFIDWEAAADEMQSDWAELDYDGVTYWIVSL